MNKLQSVMAYICLNYPYKNELSKARLTKLVYLADWFSALLDDKQITDIEWVFNHYGPYVDDVEISARNGYEYGFRIVPTTTMYGSSKCLISFDVEEPKGLLTEREQDILDAVIQKTKSMNFNDFIDYIYSTYPVRSKERYSTLNLIDLAKTYKADHQKPK